MNDLSTAQVLAWLGLTHAPTSAPGQRAVVDGDVVLFVGTAEAVNAWLRAQVRRPQAVDLSAPTS